jgi:hypothetical protein
MPAPPNTHLIKHPIPPYDECSIGQKTIFLARRHPKLLDQISEESGVSRGFTVNWAHPDRGASLPCVEAVLRAIGYRLAIVPIKLKEN